MEALSQAIPTGAPSFMSNVPPEWPTSTPVVSHSSSQPLMIPLSHENSNKALDILDFTPHLASDGEAFLFSVLPDATVHDRVDLVAPYANGIRTFACFNGAEAIRYAKSIGMTTVAGAWMNDNPEQSWYELQCLISLAIEGAVDVAVVGSEVTSWNGLSARQIVAYIDHFRMEVPNIPVTTAEKYEAMILSENQPIIDAVDLLYINFYPFWSGFHIDEAVDSLAQEYDNMRTLAKGREVWISETGWPSSGTCDVGLAAPTSENQEQYLREVLDWTESEGIVLSWFDAFEQPWKGGTEWCDVASHWGLFDAYGRIKPGPASVLAANDGVNSITNRPTIMTSTSPSRAPVTKASATNRPTTQPSKAPATDAPSVMVQDDRHRNDEQPETSSTGDANKDDTIIPETLLEDSFAPDPVYQGNKSVNDARELFDAGLIVISTSSTLALLISCAVLVAPFRFRRQPPDWLQHLSVALLSFIAGGLDSGRWFGAGMVSFLLWAGFFAASLSMPRLNAQGAMLTSFPITSVAIIAPWGYYLLQGLGYPDWSLVLYILGTFAGLFCLPYAVLIALAQNSLLTHSRFRRPYAPLPERTSGAKVSIHVPCYAEPPEIVIATLECLASSSYTNLEVLVCDNNTKDERLWIPVKAACKRLNEELGRDVFHFFHVMGIEGAKAGALNFLLDHTADDASLVALVDADYQADTRFPGCLVGFFDDSHIGFAQTAHDYRDHNESAYKSMCYWEYMPCYKAALPSVNEYDAGFTVGTMCIFRRTAIEEAGRWAEWCLTEDSEIAVRLRHVGYEGVYIRDTLGRGLIPERFEDYRKQRFRWTAGPVQQLKKHWRLYLPSQLTGSQSMQPWPKLLEIQHSLSELSVLSSPLGLALALVIAGLVVMGILPTIILPRAAWISIFIAIPGQLARLWLHYKLSGASSIRQLAGGFLARQALLLVRIVAAFNGLTSKELAWRRTPKFECVDGSICSALNETLPETLAAICVFSLGYFPLVFESVLGEQMTGLLITWIVLTASRFLCAPLLALIREVGFIIKPRLNKETMVGGNEEIKGLASTRPSANTAFEDESDDSEYTNENDGNTYDFTSINV